MGYTLTEYVSREAVQQGRVGISPAGSKATQTYILSFDDSGNGINDVHQMYKDVLGTVSRKGDGRLTRTLPKCYPAAPWLYAQALTIVGKGYRDGAASDEQFTARSNAKQDLHAKPILDEFTLWVKYFVEVEFGTVPYAVLGDTEIDVQAATSWTPPNGTPTTARTCDEWRRFCDYETNIKVSVAYAQHGQMIFQTASTNPPHSNTFSGFPRIYLPDAGYAVRWYGVPYSYVESASSSFIKYVGHVNQVAWNGHDAGALMFSGARVMRRYTPQVPDKIKTVGGKISFSTQKLCDLELMFLKTYRVCSDVPNPTNDNYITAGHNLQPWIYSSTAGEEFFYCVNVANDRPIHYSFLVERLFTDPDVA